jgi:hypothetical protein
MSFLDTMLNVIQVRPMLGATLSGLIYKELSDMTQFSKLHFDYLFIYIRSFMIINLWVLDSSLIKNLTVSSLYCNR